MQALIAAGQSDAALDIAIAALDTAGLVSADPRLPGSRRPDAVLALAPTVPRELRAVTAPGLPVDRYATLAVPTPVLAGTRSPRVQRANCERLAAAVPGAGLTWLEGVGHVAHTAAPDAVAAALTGFLRRTGDPAIAKG
jgi:pimeloyl-ACP methyl ester carboxylesterase